MRSILNQGRCSDLVDRYHRGINRARDGASADAGAQGHPLQPIIGQRAGVSVNRIAISVGDRAIDALVLLVPGPLGERKLPSLRGSAASCLGGTCQ